MAVTFLLMNLALDRCAVDVNDEAPFPVPPPPVVEEAYDADPVLLLLACDVIEAAQHDAADDLDEDATVGKVEYEEDMESPQQLDDILARLGEEVNVGFVLDITVGTEDKLPLLPLLVDLMNGGGCCFLDITWGTPPVGTGEENDDDDEDDDADFPEALPVSFLGDGPNLALLDASRFVVLELIILHLEI